MQTWSLLLSQLVDLGEVSPPSVYSTSYIEPQGELPSAAVSIASRRDLESSNNTSVAHLGAPANARIDTHSMEASSLSYDKRRGQLKHDHGTPSSSPSPRPKDLPLPSRISHPTGRLSTTTSPLDPSVSPHKSSTPSRRASNVLPLPPRSHRPFLRRASISAPGIAGVTSPIEHSRLHEHIHVGEGALDDSDSSSGSQASLSDDDDPRRDMRGARLPRDPTHPSPLSKLLVSREDSPDGHLAGDECSVDEYDTDTSDASHSPPSSSPSSSSSSKGDAAPHKSFQPLKRNEEERRPHATKLAPSYRSLTKQQSQTSMRTVTALPSDAASAHAPLTDRRLFDTSDHTPDGLKTTETKSEGLSTRRPSPQRHRAVPAPIPALGLSNMDDRMNVKANDNEPNFTSNSRLSEEQRWEIKEEEAVLREIGWKALRETLDWFAEQVKQLHSDLPRHLKHCVGRCPDVCFVIYCGPDRVACQPSQSSKIL